MAKSENDLWYGETTFEKKIIIHIPVNLQLVCNTIASKVGGDEFSIFTKVLRKDKNHFYLDSNYVIPPQEVSVTSIDYGRDPDQFVDVVIHRHPDGMHTFSGIDDKFINKNFPVSILFTQAAGFVFGRYNMPLDEDTKIQLPVEIVVDYEIGNIDISMIKRKVFSSYPYNDQKVSGPSTKEEILKKWDLTLNPEKNKEGLKKNMARAGKDGDNFELDFKNKPVAFTLQAGVDQLTELKDKLINFKKNQIFADDFWLETDYQQLVDDIGSLKDLSLELIDENKANVLPPNTIPDIKIHVGDLVYRVDSFFENMNVDIKNINEVL